METALSVNQLVSTITDRADDDPDQEPRREDRFGQLRDCFLINTLNPDMTLRNQDRFLRNGL